MKSVMSIKIFLKNHWFPLVIIFLLSFLMFNLIKGNYYSMWDLTVPPFDPSMQFYKSLLVWDTSFLGGRAYTFISNIPIYVVAYFFSLFTSVSLGMNIFYVFLFWLCGVGMYFFVYYTVDLDKKYLQVSALFSALLYMFNPFWIFRQNSVFYVLFVLSFLPFFLLFFRNAIKYYDLDKVRFLRYILLSVFSLLFMFLGLNIPVSFACVMFCFLYFFGFSIKNRKLKSFFISVTLLVPLSLITEIWWIYPNTLHASVQESFARGGQYMIDTLAGIKWWSDTQYVSYYNIFRNMAYYLRGSDNMINSWGELWTPTTAIYSSALFIFLSFLTPICSFSTLLFKELRKKTDVLLFIVVILLFIPLFALLKPPFGFIVEEIFKNVSIYVLRRPPSYMFIFSFVYAYLFGLFIYVLLRKLDSLKNMIGKLLLSLLVALIFVSNVIIFPYPQWLGYSSYMNLKDEDGDIRYVSALVDPPQYAKDVVGYLNDQEKMGGVVVFPRAEMLRGYDWGAGYFGWDYYYINLKRPVLSNSIERYKMYYVYKDLDGILNKKDADLSDVLARRLARLNVRYILITNDSLNHSLSFNYDLLYKNLAKQLNIKLIKRFGAVDVYENMLCDEYCVDFYVPNKVIRLEKNKDSVFDIESNYEGSPALQLVDNGEGVRGIYHYDINRKMSSSVLARMKKKISINQEIRGLKLVVDLDPGIEIGVYEGDYSNKSVPLRPLYYDNGNERLFNFSRSNNGGDKEIIYLFDDPKNIDYLSFYINPLDSKLINDYGFTIKSFEFILPEVDFREMLRKYETIPISEMNNYVYIFNNDIVQYHGNIENNINVESKIIRPTEYSIKVTGKINSSFVLSSSVLYDDGWEAEINGVKLEKFLVNDLFNGWIVNYKNGISSGELLISVYYSPQRKEDVANMISLFFIIVSVVLLLITFLKAKK